MLLNYSTSSLQSRCVMVDSGRQHWQWSANFVLALATPPISQKWSENGLQNAGQPKSLDRRDPMKVNAVHVAHLSISRQID